MLRVFVCICMSECLTNNLGNFSLHIFLWSYTLHIFSFSLSVWWVKNCIFKYTDTLIHLKHQNYILRHLMESRGCCCLVTESCPYSLRPHGLCSPPGSSVHGISQARILEWVAMSSSREFSWPRARTRVSWVSCFGKWVIYHWATWEAQWLLQGL